MLNAPKSCRRHRAVHAYAILCALTGISGLMLSLTVPPGTTVHRFEQTVAGQEKTLPSRTAFHLVTDRQPDAL